jgi:bifunctional isochorismate lyase/aryl carrier protein
MVWEMKEAYLSETNHKGKINTWMRALRPQRDRHSDFVYVPENSLLLVIDMQNYFIEDDAHAFIPVGKFILGKLSEIIGAYYEKNLPVVFTRYCVEREDEDDIMYRWWGEVLLCNDPIASLCKELDTEKGTVIRKPAYSAFYKTNLGQIMEKESVTQLVITGVMTHLCCETTAREAFQRGFEVYFVIDGTGTYDEEIHTATLFNLAHGFAVPVTAEEIIARLRRSHG